MESATNRETAMNIESESHRRATDTLKAAEILEALQNLTGRVDRQSQGFADRIEALTTEFEGRLKTQILLLSTMCDALAELQSVNEGLDTRIGELVQRTSHMAEELDEVTAKVEGRNKSAATKRNMTDGDALRVLNGDMTSLPHKEAAESIGLTYAQVYSARGGFTFKHIIHDLEKSGWKNPWDKINVKKA